MSPRPEVRDYLREFEERADAPARMPTWASDANPAAAPIELEPSSSARYDLMAPGDGRAHTQLDAAQVAAELIGCEPAAFRAALAVLAPHDPFDKHGFPTFEVDVAAFHARTGGEHRDVKLSRNPRERLAQLESLDLAAAAMSTAWGLGRIMGYDHHEAGAENVWEFLDAAKASGRGQLEQLASVWISGELDSALRAQDWARFAGGDAEIAGRLARKYASLSGGRSWRVLRRGDSGPAVWRLQEALSGEGFPTGADGRFGPATEDALQQFQDDRGLAMDGVAGAKTWGALALAGSVKKDSHTAPRPPEPSETPLDTVTLAGAALAGPPSQFIEGLAAQALGATFVVLIILYALRKWWRW